ncbi:unnamed protein product [Arabis nemorensis]|uniref:RRM domain-containing protein n=1 Tax=Arabis nemorensis TaxID=586526 RepID=A0A565CI04_9BRAS|nr:unnamed protein product [Arabis nemorensis]
MVVSGYDKSLGEDVIKSLLSGHSSSCGEITKVYIPTRVGSESSRNKFVSSSSSSSKLASSRDIIILLTIKYVMPPSSECCIATPELYVQLAKLNEKATPINVVMVSGFDISLPEYRVMDPLRKYFSACGEIRVVCVFSRRKWTASVEIWGLRDVVGEKAFALNGTDMGGWKAKVRRFVEPEEINFNTVYC